MTHSFIRFMKAASLHLTAACFAFAVVVFAQTTWAPGEPPAARPNEGNVELPLSGVQMAATAADLPACDSSRLGVLGYEQDAAQLVICDGTTWKDIRACL